MSTTDTSDLCKRNVNLMFGFSLISGVAYGIAMGPVFDKYLYYLGGGHIRGPKLAPSHAENSLVGLVESISGLASLGLAIPVGLLVDKNPDKRARLLKLSTIFGILGGITAILAVLSDFIIVLYITLFLLGTFQEIAYSATEAIFADSIPAGKRAALFTKKGMISLVGVGCGPMISAIGLKFIGDEWRPYQMKAVVVIGSILMALSCVPLFLFQDAPTSEENAGQASSKAEASGGVGSENAMALTRRCGPFQPRHVPFLLAFVNFVCAIGAGMTVKFFNLFFIQDEHFTPVGICVLQTMYPFIIALFMKFTEWVAKPLGRAQASLLFFGSNVICLFLLSSLKSVPVLLIVFLLRGGFANSANPIDRSILMDYTPSSQRGKWNAIETLTSVTWSGSAFLGGILSDSHDYSFTFLITAIMYSATCLAYTPLLGLVPRKESAVADSREVALGQDSALADSRELPLVGKTGAAQEERSAGA